MKKIDVKERSAERAAYALQLRKDGWSYEQIGIRLADKFANQQRNRKAFTSMYAHKLVVTALKNIYKDDAYALVRMEMERLDTMQLEAMDVLRTEHVLVSAGAIVRTMVRDAATGLPVIDPATNLPVTVPLRDDGPRLAAIDRLLKIQERRAKLMGLDKPTKVASTNPAGDKPATVFQIVASKEDMAL